MFKFRSKWSCIFIVKRYTFFWWSCCKRFSLRYLSYFSNENTKAMGSFDKLFPPNFIMKCFIQKPFYLDHLSSCEPIRWHKIPTGLREHWIFVIHEYDILDAVWASYPSGIYLFKVFNRNIRTICEIYTKLTIDTPEWRFNNRYCSSYFSYCSSVSIVNFDKCCLVVGLVSTGLCVSL